MTPDRRPSLDDLAAHPERAVGLSPHDARTLLAQLAGLVPILIATQFRESREADPASPAKDLPLQCLKPKEVAALTGLEEPYIHALCRAGTLPAFKTGKYWLIPASRFRAWQEHGGLDGLRAPGLPSPHAPRSQMGTPPAALRCPPRPGPTARRSRRPRPSTPADRPGDSAWSRPARVAARRPVSPDPVEPQAPGEGRQ